MNAAHEALGQRQRHGVPLLDHDNAVDPSSAELLQQVPSLSARPTMRQRAKVDLEQDAHQLAAQMVAEHTARSVQHAIGRAQEQADHAIPRL